MTTAKSTGSAPSVDRAWRSLGASVLTTAIVVVGTLVGLLPLCLLLDHVWLMIPIAVGAGFSAFSTLRVRTIDSGRLPTLLEATLGSVSAVYPPAILGFLLMMVYWGIYWSVSGIDWAITKWFGSGLSPEAVAFWVTVGLLAVFGFAFAALATRVLVAQLNSSVREMPLRRLSDLGEHLRQILSTVLVALATLGLFLFASARTAPQANWPTVLLQLSVMLASFYLWRKLQETSRARTTVDSRELVGGLLESAGFTVQPATEVGDAETSTLLQHIDYVAQGDGRTLAVDIRTDPEGDIDPIVLDSIKLAAWAVGQQLELAAYEVEPVLALVDVPPASGFDRAAVEAGVELLRLDASRIRRLVHATDIDPSQRLNDAQSLLAGASIWKSAV